MRATIGIDAASFAGFERSLREAFEARVGAVEYAMAETFLGCVDANFGPTGAYRLWSGWMPLSPAYAKKVGRDYATLEVSGALRECVHIELNKHFEVVADDADVPYATVHQYGGGNNIPAREYFPMDNDSGKVTRQVQDIVQGAAENKLEELLR